MRWLRSLFGWKEDDPVPDRVDPDFGPMTFDGLDSGIWQTDGDIDVPEHGARYGFSAIPGDVTGPYPWARSFLIEKRQDLPRLWELCTPALEEVCDRWEGKGLRRPVRQQFVLTSISVREDFQTSGAWDVGFEAKGKFWVYACVRLVGDRIEGCTCDT